MSITISPLAEAKSRMDGKVAVGNDLMNFQWAEDVPLAMRERAFWSARLQSAHMAQGMLEMLKKGASLETQTVERQGKPVELTMSRSLFVREGKKMLDAAGYKPTDPAWEGTMLDHSSRQRLGLIWDFNTRQAGEYARWKGGQQEGALDAFPAQELIREEARVVPRPWHERWRDHGGQSFGGRMIALKSDPIWSDISSFGTPFPPYDFGSGMGVMDVARDEAEALGLIAPGEKPERADVGFNDSLQASVRGLDRPVVDALMRSLGDQAELSGDIVKWRDQPGHQLSFLFNPESVSGSEASVVALKEGLADLSLVVRLPDGPIIPMRETAKMHHKGAEGEYWPKETGEQHIDVLAPKLPSGRLAQAHEVGHFLDELLNEGRPGYASEKSAKADVVGVMQAIHDSPVRKMAVAMDRVAGKRYFARDAELFARAFERWQAEKTGDDLQIKLLDRRAKDFPHAAWTKDAFKPIAEALDYLFSKRRLRS